MYIAIMNIILSIRQRLINNTNNFFLLMESLPNPACFGLQKMWFDIILWHNEVSGDALGDLASIAFRDVISLRGEMGSCNPWVSDLCTHDMENY